MQRNQNSSQNILNGTNNVHEMLCMWLNNMHENTKP
jgi:hypothetical protein